MRTRLRLDWALCGYLVTPAGRPRRIEAIERLAEDTLRLGVRVWWDDTMPSVGYAYCWSRIVLLSPSLLDEEPWYLRSVWSEELCHILAGPSHERALALQRRTYKDIIEPAWAL